MGAGGVPGLLLVMLLTMPGTRAENCEKGEYFHEGRCCLSCSAGTFVAQHCSVPHLRGKCDPCKKGESYTAHENGLDECLSCRLCKDDQVTVRPCTLTRNTECQCKEGYFCTDEACEMCQRHSKMYPKEEEMQDCNATLGLGCDLPVQGSTAFSWVIPIIFVPVFVLLFLVFRRMKCDKDAFASKQDYHKVLKKDFLFDNTRQVAASTDKDAKKSLKSEDCTESLILPEVKPPANNTMNLEGENSGGSSESQARNDVTLEVENTSPEEDSALAEQGTVLSEGWKCCVLRQLRRITEFSLLAKPGQNSAFHQNSVSNGLCSGMPTNREVRKLKHRIIIKDLSQKELRASFEAFIKEVPLKKWKRLMRTHLQEHDIDKIIYNFHNDIEEQAYQMLLCWRNALGEKQCIIELLEELKHIDTKAYDNVLNTLKINNIISKVEGTD